MNILFFYFLFTILVIFIILIVYAIVYNRFQEYIIRINEVESEIDNNLRNKYDLVNRSLSIIKGNINIEKEIFEEVFKLRTMKISNFDLDRKLVEANDELVLLKEEYSSKLKSDELKKIDKSINEIDNKLMSLKKYYNDTIVEYNSLIRRFPTNIVSSLCKYKEKLFFDRKDMYDDEEEDFKL